MKKLINWLIKKLGGYTEEEYEIVMDNWGEALALTDALHENDKNIIRHTESNADYWFDKFMAEYRAYLALLNAHNATAEAAQQNTSGVSGAIYTIKAYCKSKGSCDECALYNENSGCKIHEIPCYWGEK